MGKAKRRGNRAVVRRPSATESQPGKRSNDTRRTAAIQPKLKSRYLDFLAFAGYTLAVWLIMPVIYRFSDTPTSGWVWSSAALGLLVVFVTALLKNELGLRSRLRVFDSKQVGQRSSLLAWGGLGLISMALLASLPVF